MTDEKYLPQVFEDRLANGMKLLVLEDRSAPVATVQVWIRAGSRNERPGIRGLAHLLEHLMFKGSRDVGPEEHARIIDAVGGQENAFTSEDVTAYFDTVTAEYLELALMLEAERFGFARLDETHFFKEREVVKEEIRQAQQNDPMGHLMERFRAEAFTAHPYAWGPGGTLEDLDAMTPADARAFYRAHYHPGNAVLIVAGSAVLERVRAVAERVFGGIPPGPPPPPVTAAEPEQQALRRCEIVFPTELPMVVAGYKSVPAAHADSPALEVIQRILGAGKSSRLHRALVREKRLAVFAGAWNWSMLDPGLMVLSAGFVPEQDGAALEEALLAEIERLRRDGPTPEELEKAKNQLVAEHVFERASFESAAFALGTAECILGDWRRFREGAERFWAVSAADVIRVAVAYLRPERLTLAVMRPPVEGEQVSKAPPTQVAEAEQKTASWPTAERFRRFPPPALDDVPLPPLERARLSCGLQAVCARKPELPLVALELVLPGGDALDPPGRAGLAETLAEMLSQGTVRHDAESLAESLDGLGARLGPGTGAEFFRVSGRCLARHFPRLLELLAEMVREPTLPAQELERLLPQKEGALRMQKDQPLSLAFEHLRTLIFSYDHPRGRPASIETVRAIRREDLCRLRDGWLRPEGGFLGIAGAMDPDEALALCQRHLGDWRVPVGPAFEPAPVPRRPPRRRLVDKPDVTQASLAVGHAGLARTHPDFPALVLANHVLGGSGFSSRLMKAVRAEGGKTYGAGSFLAAGRGPGFFAAYTFTRNPEAAATLELLLAEIRRIREQGVEEQELAAIRQNLVGGYPITLQPADGTIEELVFADFFGLGEEWVRGYRRRFGGIGRAEVNAALARHLDPAALSIVAVGPARDLAGPLAAFGEFEVVSYQEPAPEEERRGRTSARLTP